MRGKKISLLMVFLVLIAGVGYGQSKKNIREKKIISRTVDEYFIEEGMDDPVVESIEKFNVKGELIEIQVFNKREEVKKWEKYVYNEDGKLIEEIFLDERGRVDRTEKNIYDEDLRIEKQYYNKRGDMYKKKIYKYEYRQ